MRIVRFRPRARAPLTWGWVDDDRVGLIDGSPFQEFRREKASLSLSSVELGPPVQPGKIICIGRNYPAHAAEHGAEVPALPLIFLKPPSAVIGPGEAIVTPPQSSRVEHEAELAVVIGQAGRWIHTEEAEKHILGYTVANDVTARDLQMSDGQWSRAKGFDTFCPLGPWIDTDVNSADLLITCTVNGQMRQMGSTRDMVFPVRHLVTYISSVMTLDPGDLILTGTPAGVGLLTPGDEVTVDIEGLGRLTNPVRADPHSA